MVVLTDEMRQLLERGAASSYGRICFPFEWRRQKLVALLMQMEGAGLLWWGGFNRDTPIVTEAGRRAVNGPSNAELLARAVANLCGDAP